ncbi:MAG TPA: protein kinase, partial [Gemmataceae bacterium]|nr:protein kinase [Gemmataceae bacterium]
FQVAFKFVSLAGRAGAIEQKALMVIRNIRHPNLLSIFGVWQLDGWLAVGMELADRTLHDRLKEALDRSLPGIPRRELVRYVLDAAAVIDYLNKPRHFLDGGKPVGIQHGDVKPQNIFLIGEGVKVGDFGLVRLLERAVVQHEGGLTRAYAAPEVLAGQMSRWSDQFALAVTYCFLRGGRLPFTGLDRDRPDLSMLPEEECAAVRRALERDPRQRWPSCRAFVKALAESKRPPSPAPPVVPTPVPVVTTETTVPPEPPRPFRPRVVPRKLRVIAGPDTEKVFELPPSGTVFLGRDKERTLTKFTERTISRTHCRLEVSGERVLLINESLAGTLVNERPVTQHELKSGDLIRLGEESQTKLVFEVEEETATIRGGKLYSLRDDRSLVGKTVGHFQIVKLLDASPSGTTYRARDTSSNRDVALKVFVPDRSLPERFRMMQPVLGLQHPNLLTLYEAGEHEVGYWVAMECAEGASLEQLQERIGPTGSFVWHQVVRFALQAAEGLNALHQREIVHRAITPRALLLGRSSNELKLGGLWRARALSDCKMDSADTQDVLRHVRYMPPERAGFGKPATVRGDLYSLGAVLYHLLTGRPPFIGESDKAIIFHIVQTEPLPLGHFQPTIPRPLAQIVLRLLAKRPEDRYQSAQELLMALQPLAGIEVYQEPIRPVPLLPSRGTGENLDLEATPPPEAPDHPEPPAPAPGPVGAGRYQIVRELGLGGLGVVYLARDTRLDRLVALKLFPFASGENSEAMLRFARDAVWASKLDHPNICPVLDVYENAGRLVVVMAYIEGESLAKAIRREQPMAQRRVLEFVAKLARTLDFAHKRGVLHGDLKPANVIIDHRGEPILMDLGRGFRPLQNLHATQEGSLMGTPAYLSPEQVRGAVKEVGPASDQWSLGVILYEMLTGQVPFQGTVGHVLASIINRKPRPPRELRPDIDPVLEAICLKAMSANMAERFPSMADCAQALENTVAICPTPGADLGPAPAAAPPTVGSDAASTPAFGGVFRQVSKRSMDAPGSGNLTVGSRPEWKRAGPAWESTSPLKRGRLWWRLLGAVLCCASFGLVLLLSSVLTKPAAERPTSETSGLLPLLLLGGALFAALLGILLWRWRSRKGWGEVMFGMARTARDTQPEAPVEVEAVCATLSPQAGPAPPKFLVDIVRSIARRGGVATEAETQLLLRLEEIHQGCPTTPEEEEQIRRRVEEITRDGEPSERAAP